MSRMPMSSSTHTLSTWMKTIGSILKYFVQNATLTATTVLFRPIDFFRLEQVRFLFFFFLFSFKLNNSCNIAGKRSCLGESLARASYFLFSASLVKTFTFRSSSDDSPFPSLVPLNGFTLAHRPFRAFLAQR